MLRQNLTYTGHVVSDCGAVNNIQEQQLYHNDTPAQGAADALNAGTDLNCGDGYDVLNESLELKLTTSTAIDLALSRTLKGRFDLSQFNPIAQDPWSNITIDQVNA